MDHRYPTGSAAGTGRSQLSDDAMNALREGPEAIWTTRLSALVELADAAMNEQMCIPDSPARDHLTEQLRAISVGIALCVGDLRSTLVKEVCTVLTTLSGVLGPRLVEAIGDDVIPALLRRSATRKSVIRLSAIAAGTAMLQRGAAGVSARLALHMTESVLDGKNPPYVRASAAEYLGVMLDTELAEALEKMGPELDSAILVGCTDATDSVRAISRENLRRLQNVDKDRARRVMQNLPKKVRQLLEKKTISPASPLRPDPRPLYPTVATAVAPRLPRRSMLTAAKRRESREPSARAAATAPVGKNRPASTTSFARAPRPPHPHRTDGASGDEEAALPPSAPKAFNKAERRVPRARSYSMMPSRVPPLSSAALPAPSTNRPWTKLQPQARKPMALRPARRSMMPGAVPFVPPPPWTSRTAKSPVRILESNSSESLVPSPVPAAKDDGIADVEELAKSLSATTLSSSSSIDENPIDSTEVSEGIVRDGKPANVVSPERRVSVSSSSTQSSSRLPSEESATKLQDRRESAYSSSLASSKEESSSTVQEENSLTRSSSRCSLKEGSHSLNISESGSQESISTILNRAVLSVPDVPFNQPGAARNGKSSRRQDVVHNEESTNSFIEDALDVHAVKTPNPRPGNSITDLLNNSLQFPPEPRPPARTSQKGRISFLLGESVTPRPTQKLEESTAAQIAPSPSDAFKVKTKSPTFSETAVAQNAPADGKLVSPLNTSTRPTEVQYPLGSRTSISRIAKPVPGRAGALGSRNTKIASRSSVQKIRRVPVPRGKGPHRGEINKENSQSVLGAQVLYRKRQSTISGIPRSFGRELNSNSNVQNMSPKNSPMQKEKTEPSGLVALVEAVKDAEKRRSATWQSRMQAAKALMSACASLQKESLSAKLAERTTEALAVYAHDVHLRVVTHALDGAFYLLLNASASSGQLFTALERRPALLRAVLGRTTDKREAARLAAERVIQSFAVLFCSEQQTALLVRSHERGTSRLPVTCNAVADVLRRTKDVKPTGRVLDGIIDMVSEGSAHRLVNVRKAAAELGNELREAVETDALHEACERRKFCCMDRCLGDVLEGFLQNRSLWRKL